MQSGLLPVDLLYLPAAIGQLLVLQRCEFHTHLHIDGRSLARAVGAALGADMTEHRVCLGRSISCQERCAPCRGMRWRILRRFSRGATHREGRQKLLTRNSTHTLPSTRRADAQFHVLLRFRCSFKSFCVYYPRHNMDDRAGRCRWAVPHTQLDSRARIDRRDSIHLRNPPLLSRIRVPVHPQGMRTKESR